MAAEDDPVEEVFTTAGDEVQQFDEDLNDDTFDFQFADYDEQADDAAAGEEFEPDELPEYEAGDDGGDEHQAMTATSKRLAATMQSRGYYTTAKDKGKGKGHGKGAGKDKGFGKKGTTSSSSPAKMNPNQRLRAQASLCLGCGASDHWLRECPHVTQHQAHVCSARPLPSARHPAVTPPGDARSSFMAEALASAAGPLEATPARRHYQELHGSLHGGDHADLDGGNGSAGQHADPDLPERSNGVRTPLRSSSLRGGRPGRSHLRPVRFQSSDPQGSDDPSAAQSKSSCSNPSTIAGAHLTTQQKQSRRQSIKSQLVPQDSNVLARDLSCLSLRATSRNHLSWTHQQLLQQQVEDQVQRRLQEIGPQVEAQVQHRLEQMAKAKAPMPSTRAMSVPEIPLDNGSTASWDQVGSQWNQDWNILEQPWDQPYDWTEEIKEQHEDYENDQENFPDIGQEQMSLDGSALGSLKPQLSGSADRPLTFEDRGFQLLKPGRRKRLLHTVRQLRQLWLTELQIYDNVIQAARKLRHTSEVDLIEIYGGHCNITEEALSRGLRCLQPVDKIHGISLDSKAGSIDGDLCYRFWSLNADSGHL